MRSRNRINRNNRPDGGPSANGRLEWSRTISLECPPAALDSQRPPPLPNRTRGHRKAVCRRVLQSVGHGSAPLVIIAMRPTILRGWIFIAAFIAALVVLSSGSVVYAQEDPFDLGTGDEGAGLFEGGFNFDAPADSPPAAEPSGAGVPEEEEVSVVVAQLRRYAAGTPRQLGVAIREAIRMRLWDELERFLDPARINALAPGERSRVAAVIGGPLLARARTEAALDPEARDALATLESAAATIATSAATLDAAIDALGSDSRDAQLGATRRLLSGGDAALARLAAAASQADPPAPRGRITEVLRGFGGAAVDAVTQLALYGADSVRPGALRTLYALDARRATAPLVAALHAPSSTADERDVAAAALERMLRSLPSRREAEIYLRDRLARAEQAYAIADYSFPATSVWQTDETRTSVRPITPTPPVATARRAVDAAEMLRRVGGLRPDTLSAAMRADLRYRLLVDPAFGSEADLDALRSRWGQATADPDALSRLLADSLGEPSPLGDASGDAAAAVAVLRLMAAAGDADVVYSPGPEPSPLVAAASHPMPRVRYEAASTVGALTPDRPYASSNVVLDRWIEMSRLDDAPLALMMINHPETASLMESHLAEFGYRVVRYGSGGALVRALDEGGDVQLIVAPTEPPDMMAIELVDRVRRRPFGAAAPMLLIGPLSERLETIADRWSAPTVAMMPPQTLVALASTLRPMIDAKALPPLSPAERQGFALEGVSILSKLSGERSQRLYDLTSHEGALIDASRRSGFDAPSLAVLSALGSPQSQELLASLAGSSTGDTELRRRAADAFAASVEQFGTRLSRQQVAAQYERFNATGDDASREVIGRILDAMETRVGVSTAQ